PNAGLGLVTSGVLAVTKSSFPFSKITDSTNTGASTGAGLTLPEGLDWVILEEPIERFTLEILTLFSVPVTVTVWAATKSMENRSTKAFRRSIFRQRSRLPVRDRTFFIFQHLQ